MPLPNVVATCTLIGIYIQIIYLLGIRIPEVYKLGGIPQRESKSMRRRRVFSLLDSGQCSGIVYGSHMAIDSPANDWFLTSEAKQ